MTNKKNNEVIDQKYNDVKVRFLTPDNGPDSYFSFTVFEIKEIKECSKQIRVSSDDIDDDLQADIDAVDNLLDNERIMTALTAATETPQVEARTSDLAAIICVLTEVSYISLSAHKTFMFGIISLILKARLKSR